jgi:asparagine synthase (glutamine-hydrolysing)
MCGINGIFAYRPGADPIDRGELARTRDHMTKRGPDDFGEWVSPEGSIGFGHRRLSIIDLSPAGAQPMTSADGKFTVTFNGEIYNYQALRRDLETRGFVFKSHSDTEVLLHLYALKGAAMVGDLCGMFAFALWDAERRELFLARDPYGIKPLYYADEEGTFRFASTVKALLAGGRISREPDPAGVVGFYLFGSVPEPFTTYRSICSLPAGATITVGAAEVGEPKSYFSIPGVLKEAEAKSRFEQSDDPSTSFREAMLDSVRRHLVADVPVGAFLSAGVDSGSLVGLMRDAGQSQIETITIAFEEFRGASSDEAPLAERLAQYYGSKHTTRRVDAAEFARDLPDILAAMDQPSVDGVNTWFVSKAAREIGLKVAISGVGGDELLGGYTTFESLPRFVGWLGRPSRTVGVREAYEHAFAAARKLGVRMHPKAAGLLRYGGDMPGAYLLLRGLFLPSELGEVLDDWDFTQQGLARLNPIAHLANALKDGPSAPFGVVAAFESCFYLRNQLLRDTDWAGMAHSLEIRTPFIDSRLLCEAAPILARDDPPSGKKLLAAAPSRPLPAEILNRKKTGFGMPLQAWTRKALLSDERGEAAKGDGHKEDKAAWSRFWARRVLRMSTSA